MGALGFSGPSVGTRCARERKHIAAPYALTPPTPLVPHAARSYEFLMENADALDTNLKLIPLYNPSMSRKEGLEMLHAYLELLVGLLRWYPNR